MACDFEYCVYDPAVTQTVIPYSNNPIVPGSIIEAVHALCPESIGEKFIYLTKYNGNSNHVCVPNEILGIKVRAINCFSLKKHSFIKAIDLPETVCLLHKNALKGCTGLEQINIASETQPLYISGETLRNCKKLFVHGICIIAGCIFSDPCCDEIVEFTIPQGVHTIASHAFEKHRFLQKLIIPETVKEIGNFAFAYCNQLKSVEIQGSPEIRDSIFSGCESLSHISFNQSMEHIGSYAFSGCNNLRSFRIPNGIKQIMGWFDGCKQLRNVVFPNSLETISYRSFSNCRSLQHLELPDSVTCISRGAFDNCINLQKVLIHSKDIVIETDSFQNCPSLVLEAFPEAEKKIAATGLDCVIVESGGFDYTLRSKIYQIIPSLEILNTALPAIHTETNHRIGNSVSVCYNVRKTLKALKQSADQYELYTAEQYYLSKEDVADQILQEDPEMRTDAYYLAKPAIASHAPKLTEDLYVRYRLFWEFLCHQIAQPAILEKIVDILPRDKEGSLREGSEINIACSGIVESSTKIIVLIAKATSPSTVEITVQKKKFSYTELGKIEDDLFSTYPGLFADVFKIPDCYLSRPNKRMARRQEPEPASDNVSKLEETDSILSAAVDPVIRMNAYKGQSIEKIVIPEGVIEIGAWAFEGCTSLAEVHLPSTLQKIGVAAFQNCTALKSILIPETVSYIGDGAFEDCTMLTSISLPKNIHKLCDSLFKNCNCLESVDLPPNLEHIGARVFSHCSNLRTIEIPKTVKHIEYSAFSDCSSICEIQLPESMETLQGRVFKGCVQLRYFVMPKGVTSVGKRMFLGCCALESATLPDGVTKIGESAFEGCSAVKEIIMPDSLICIENKAFSGCTTLNRVTFPGSLSKVGSAVFEGCNDVTVFFKGMPACLKKIQKEGWRFVEI